MTTPAARFLNAEKGGTAESKMQKDGKSKCQIVYRDYNAQKFGSANYNWHQADF